MPLRAVRLASLLFPTSSTSVSPLYVLGVSHGFQVPRVDEPPIAAKVVQLQPLRDRAEQPLVHDDVTTLPARSLRATGVPVPS